MGNWTKKQLAYLVENYSNTKNSILASSIGKNKCAIYEKAKRMGLKKSSSFLKEVHIGHVGHNRLPLFSERLTTDGYIKVKVAEPDKWKLKHHIIWEKNNGKIPKGTHVCFKDGNRKNVCIENLYISCIDAKKIYEEIVVKEKKVETLKDMRSMLDTLRRLEKKQAESGDVEGFVATRRKADMLYYKIESISK